MKLSLSGVTPFVIGELLIPCFRVLTEMSLRGGGLCWVFREGTCDDYIKLHSIQLLRLLMFFYTAVNYATFHSMVVSLKLQHGHSEQIKRVKQLFHGSRPGGFCVVLIE